MRLEWSSGEESSDEPAADEWPDEQEEEEAHYGLNADLTGVDHQVLAALPQHVQLEILDECKEKQRVERHMMFRGARRADVGPAKFSDLQVSA